MKKVLTVGVFDLFHYGHLALFEKCKQQGNYLIVAVQDSEWILKYKPDCQMVYTTDQRVTMIRALRVVDEVVVYRDVDSFVTTIDFDVFCRGEDQTHEGFQRAVRWCENNGKTVVVMSRTKGVSSRDLKERSVVHEGDLRH